jgi:hypothetical protein
MRDLWVTNSRHTPSLFDIYFKAPKAFHVNLHYFPKRRLKARPKIVLMEGITNATFTSQDWAYFKYPMSLSPLPQFMKPGIIALCAFSLLSCIATLGLLGFLAYRFIAGRNDRQAPLYKNQYMLLIFSLVLADFQCDLGFFLDVIWLHRKQIVAPSVSCFIQGWLVNIGDLGSGFFVFAIACHTFYNVVCGRKLQLATLRLCIIGLWILAIVLTIVPIALHPKDIFVTQGNWVRSRTAFVP